MKFEKNVGGIDRAIRLMAAAVLLFLGFVDSSLVAPGTAKTMMGIFGFLPLLTGAFSFCPLYSLINVSTCPKSSSAN